MAKVIDAVKYQILAELREGKKSKELSEKYGVPYITIQTWKQKLNKGGADEKIQQLVQIDESALQVVVEKVKESAPPKVAKEIEKVVDGVVGLQKLEPEFHTLVTKLLTKAESFADAEDLAVKDWVAISNSIGLLYANIFNKSGVNVNVLNQTTVHGEKMSMFKGSMRD